MSVPPKSLVARSEHLWHIDLPESSLFKALLYFDIFNFPLTLEEILKFTGFENACAARQALNKWTLQGLIMQQGDYYAVQSLDEILAQRKKAMFRADCMIARGMKNAVLMQRFPFVRAVFFSGSISKGVVAEDGDVDFFIIARPGRLWLSRTLLALYKKIFLRGSHKYFCINYFIDSRHLEIEEKNLFTATEMTTLVPVCGDQQLIQDFFQVNPWVRDFYPNHKPGAVLLKTKKSLRKRMLEILLTLSGAVWLDKFSRKLTTSFWRRKFNKMPDEEFEVALKSRQHVSKHHPQNFQKKVLKAFQTKLNEFEETHNLKFADA